MKKPIVIKKYLKFYEETARNRIFGVLFNYPDKEFSLSELAMEAGVAKANIGKILDELYKNEIIEITKLSKIWRIKANQRNWIFTKSKIVYNLNFVYQSGLVEFLADYFKNPKSIILFGSFRNGADNSDSDIDIAVENEEEKEYKTIVLRELVDFEKTINRRIQIHIFNKKNIDKGLFNSIANGIVLFGFLEV